jgi:hypothetical protein
VLFDPARIGLHEAGSASFIAPITDPDIVLMHVPAGVSVLPKLKPARADKALLFGDRLAF